MMAISPRTSAITTNVLFSDQQQFCLPIRKHDGWHTGYNEWISDDDDAIYDTIYNGYL
jgi:hypothetical protein